MSLNEVYIQWYSVLEQLTQINNPTEEATAAHSANANNPLWLSSLFGGIHWFPEPWRTVVERPASEEHSSLYLRSRFGQGQESPVGWVVRTLPDQDPVMKQDLGVQAPAEADLTTVGGKVVPAAERPASGPKLSPAANQMYLNRL